MNSNFWQSSNYGTSSENDHEGTENISSFSSNLRSLDINYDTSSMLGLQTGAPSPGLVQAVSPSSTDVHYRMASSTPHTPSDTLFHPSANAGPTFNNPTSLPGFALTHNLSSYSLLHNPTLYAPNNDASYNIAHTTSSHQTYTSTANCAQTFTPQSSFEHRNHLGISSSLHSGMPPPLRNALFPTSPSLIPMSVRHHYSPTSHHNRPLQSNVDPFQLTSSPSPPLSLISRGVSSVADRTSPSGSYGYGPGPLHLDIPATEGSAKKSPAFRATKGFHELIDDSGRHITPELHARIEKGFHMSDTADWYCYRRNYFSVACSYNLIGARGEIDHRNIYLVKADQRDIIHGFYVCIAARVDGEDGRAVDLVLHTAKRDKGPMIPPAKRALRPNPTGNLGVFSSNSTFESPHQSIGGEYHDPYQLGNPQDNPSVTNYDRIQFKKATANNGKRRAAQQYFHVVVELYAKTRDLNGDEEYTKVAHRLSDPMVVRGRSPGHYADGTRTSSNMGGGTGAGGGYGTASRDLGSGCSINPDPSMDTGHHSIRSGGPSTYHSNSHIATIPYTNLSPLPSASSDIYYHQHMENVPQHQNSIHPQASVDWRAKYCSDQGSQSRLYSSVGYMSKPPASTMFGKSALVQTPSNSPDSYTSISTTRDEPLFKRYIKMEEKHGTSPIQLPLLST